MRTTILGGGSWGTALAHLLAANGHHVTLLVRHPEQAAEITTQHTNAVYLPDLALHTAVQATTDDAKALAGCELCISTIPCQHTRTCLAKLATHISPTTLFCCASKGIELNTLHCMHSVVAETLPHQAATFSILSGPSFAQEVMQNLPTAVVLGCTHAQTGKKLQDVFSNNTFRTYSSTDVMGVQLGGALKNIIAIAAGISDGLRLGHNARAALITRGLAEITRLGLALGAQPTTFMGLSGLGDLLLTCTGDLSRNRQVGLRLGKGETLPAITGNLHNVVEGLATTTAACILGEKMNVDLPIAGAIRRIVENGASPQQMAETLMRRNLKTE